MSDHDDRALDEAAFDDPQFDEVRGRLADARVTEPIPADVAARLDATLGALREERRAEADRDAVVPLRRRAGRVLVAAAAVVAVAAGGFGIVKTDLSGSSSDDKASSGAIADQAEGGSVSPSAPPDAVAPNAQSLKELTVLRHLTTAHFARDVARSMRALTLSSEHTGGDTASEGSGSTGSAPGDTSSNTTGDLDSRAARDQAPPVTATPPEPASAAESAAGSCAGPAAPDAVTLPATLDGVRVALVFRPPTASAQLVEAWSCDGTSLLASATVRH